MAFNQPEEFILLSTLTASNSASLSFTSLITSTYPVYYVKVRNLLPQSNSNLLLLFSTNNGSTYLATNYQWSSYIANESALNTSNSNSDTSLPIIVGTSTSATRAINCEFYCFGFAQSLRPSITIDSVGYPNSNHLELVNFSGSNSGTTAINAIQFKMASGNIVSGSISLYGMVK